MHSSTIVGYTYAVENFTPSGVIEALIADGLASPAARDMNSETAMLQIAESNSIDYGNLYSYDSSEFPKPIFADQIQDGETFLDADGNYVDPLD